MNCVRLLRDFEVKIGRFQIKQNVLNLKRTLANSSLLDEKDERDKEMFDNLATLAEVSLATAGKLEADQSLKRKIDQARAKITSNKVTTKTILPITPEMSSKRTMQVKFLPTVLKGQRS